MVNGVYGDAFILRDGKIHQRGFVIVNGSHLVLLFHRETFCESGPRREFFFVDGPFEECAHMTSWQHITQTCLTICIHRRPLGTRLCQSNRFCGRTELPLHVSIRKNDFLEEECYKPIAYGHGTANHPESANRSFPLVATVRSDPKSFFDDQGIKPQQRVKKPSQAANRERKRWTQGSQRQKSWSEHSSRSDQQSIRNSPETAPLLGTQPA